jgi:hypothetical protein
MQKNRLYRELDKERTYILSAIKFRKEGDNFLIGNGGGFVIGNEETLNFIQEIKGKPFTPKSIKNSFGQAGENIITYLYNKGLVKNEL